MKLTRLERSWILYDVGNSAFIMLVSTIIPIFFKNIAASQGIADADSTAFWGYASSAATLIIALLGPVLGTVADGRGRKRPLFMGFLLLGILALALLGFMPTWLLFLFMFVVAKVGYSGSIVFYDSMLTDVADNERMDAVSSHGYAWGYIGSCIPFAACLLLVLGALSLGMTAQNATALAFILTAVWWALMSVPLLRRYEQRYFVEPARNQVRESLRMLKRTLGHIRENRAAFRFLLAFFFYIDGVYTIIEMATSYGKDVGIGDNDLLLALLLTQIVAFPFAILFGALAKRFAAKRLISVCIIAYFGIALFALQLDRTWEFWFLAVCVAMFQGGIQALSRSYFAKLIPKEHSNQFFGFFDIFGKGAAFTGTLLMGVVTQLSGTSTMGVAVIAAMFVAGFFLFRSVPDQETGTRRAG